MWFYQKVHNRIMQTVTMLLVPRLNAHFPRSVVDRSTSQAVEKLEYTQATEHQTEVIRELC